MAQRNTATKYWNIQPKRSDIAVMLLCILFLVLLYVSQGCCSAVAGEEKCFGMIKISHCNKFDAVTSLCFRCAFVYIITLSWWFCWYLQRCRRDFSHKIPLTRFRYQKYVHANNYKCSAQWQYWECRVNAVHKRCDGHESTVLHDSPSPFYHSI